MPRTARNAPGGIVYHVLNRASGRSKLFTKEEDFLTFEQVLQLAFERVPIRILGWCMMSNHWHLVLWPQRDGELTAFVRRLTLTHAQRWKHAHNAVGQGHLYQGRFKSFPIEKDEHLLKVLRFVERNPVRAGSVRRAEDWKWGSAHVRRKPRHELAALLAECPVAPPSNWTRLVNEPQTKEEEEALALHIKRGRPFGDAAWVKRTAGRLGLESSLRSQGRQLGWRKIKEPVGGKKPAQGLRHR
jgi:putative transposase